LEWPSDDSQVLCLKLVTIIVIQVIVYIKIIILRQARVINKQELSININIKMVLLV